MTATKSQLIEFICKTFVDSEGKYPTKSQLDVFKKDDLAKIIADVNAEEALDTYIASFS